MALTVARDKQPSGNNRGEQLLKILMWDSGTIDFDSSYPTGGEAFVTKVRTPRVVVFDNTQGYQFEYDKTNEKIKVYYADYDAGADGALIEVANTTDLSALTDVEFFVIGFDR